MIRRVFALALVAIGVYLAYHAGSAAGAYAARGGGWGAVFTDPAFVLRLSSALLITLGATLALLGQKGGAILALLGTAAFGLLTGAIVGSGADQSMWQDEVITFAIVAVLTLLLLFTKRRA